MGYLGKISKMLASGELNTEDGQISEISILHDQTCNKLRGKGQCNCNPEIEAQSVKEDRH